MRHVEEIMRAICRLVSRGLTPFRRMDVRNELGFDAETWLQSYTAIFQGMRADHPGGAPQIAHEFRDVIRRVSYGNYILTKRGQALCRMMQ